MRTFTSIMIGLPIGLGFSWLFLPRINGWPDSTATLIFTIVICFLAAMSLAAIPGLRPILLAFVFSISPFIFEVLRHRDPFSMQSLHASIPLLLYDVVACGWPAFAGGIGGIILRKRGAPAQALVAAAGIAAILALIGPPVFI